MSTEVLYCLCHSDSASFLLYFTLSTIKVAFLDIVVAGVIHVSQQFLCFGQFPFRYSEPGQMSGELMS